MPRSPGGFGESCAQPTGNILRITTASAGDRLLAARRSGKAGMASTDSRPADLRREREMHNPQPYYHYKLMYNKNLSEGRNL
ncbi:MAG: hypothetical protein OXG55_11295 [bacterium]|nr:hypothetical protein [bacterium]